MRPGNLWAQGAGNLLARALYVLQLVVMLRVVLWLWRRFVKIPQQQMEAQLAASQQQTQAATLQVALITWRAAAQLAASQRQTEAATRQVVEIMDQAAAQLAASQRQMETRLVALREEFAAARRRETHSARQHTAAQARVGRRAPKRANGGAYHPNRCQLADARLAEFVRAPITGNPTEVPGIGPTGAIVLATGEDRVTTTHQLIGKFLGLRGADEAHREADSVEHCDRFWAWLESKGVNSHRSGIVQAIAMKVNTWIPGTYEADMYA